MKSSMLRKVLRIFFVSVYAFLVMILVRITMPKDWVFTPRPFQLIFLLVYLSIFNIYTEGSLFLNRRFNNKFPWIDNPQKRLLVQVLIIFLWSLISIGIPFTIWYFVNGKSLAYPQFSVLTFIAAIVFLMGIIGISATRDFFKNWKTSLLEAEYYKQEKLKSDYKVLQNQVNPHFLFNSLNVLISEIKHDPDTAVEFTRKLSRVYRYVLQSKNYDLIKLNKELEFIKSYVFLNKVRIGSALQFSIDVSKEFLEKELPPLTLQILVENALKHNIVNEENKLTVSISSNSKNELIIRNNLNPKQEIHSTQTGLSNIKNRYDLLNIGKFRFQKTTQEFIVTVPLIDE